MEKLKVLLLGVLFVTSFSLHSESEGPLTVTKDFHQDVFDSIGDYFSDEFYSSKEEIWMPSQKFNALKSRGPGDLCYQMRYDRKNLTYKLPNGTSLDLKRKKYYQGGTLFTDCLINNKFKCLRLYYVGDGFICSTFEVEGGVRYLDLKLNEKKPQKLKNCGLFPMETKHVNKVFISVGDVKKGQSGFSFGQGDLPKTNIKREIDHGECKIELKNKLVSQKKGIIYNSKKTHATGVSQTGTYKCHIAGGDIDIEDELICDGITLGNQAIKCHKGSEVELIRFSKKCFKPSGETILSVEDTAIQDSSRKPQIPKIKNQIKKKLDNSKVQ